MPSGTLGSQLSSHPCCVCLIVGLWVSRTQTDLLSATAVYNG